MPSHRNISLYDCHHKPLRYIDSTEANKLTSDGSHEYFCVSCGRAKGEGPCLVERNHRMAVRQVVLEGDNNAGRKTDCALTARDATRNVGITCLFRGDPQDETEINAHQHQVRTAQNRIKFWGKASMNNRAVTVVPADIFKGEQFRPVRQGRFTAGDGLGE